MAGSRIPRWAIVVVIAVLGLLAGSCTSGDGESSDPSSTTSSDLTAGSTAAGGAGPTDTLLTQGEIEVGLTTHFPALALDWVTVPMELPDPAPPNVWLAAISVDDGGLAVVGYAYGPPPGNQTVFTWRSTDGDEWTRTVLPIPPGETVNRVVATGRGLVALGSRSTLDGYEPLVWFEDGAAGWREVDLSTSGVEVTGIDLAFAASTDAGYVLGGRRDDYQPVVSVTFESDGLRFELDEIGGTYVVSDIETGRPVTSGPTNDIYGSYEEGQPIYDLDSGELLTVVPWPTWEPVYRTGPPLPIPIPLDPDESTAVTIEWDGYRIVLDDERNRFEVFGDSNELITSGAVHELYRGPSPSFVDDATGGVVVTFTWEEWDRLVGLAYEVIDDSHVSHSSQQLVLFSPDGVTWGEQRLSSGDNSHLESVLAVNEEFIVTLVEHGEHGPVRTTWVSVDGVEWSATQNAGPEYVGQTVAGPSGAIALVYDGEISTIATSEDGRSWTTSFFLAPQTDDRDGWLRLVASGGAGRAALATLNPVHTGELLTVTVGDRTLRIGLPESAVEIVDDRTGQILLAAGWEELERAAELGLTAPVSYADGVTSFWAEDGELLMSLGDDVAQAALDDQAKRYEASVEHAVFLETGESWFEVQLPPLDGREPGQLAVGDDRVIVGMVAYGEGPDAGGVGVSLLVGRLAGDAPRS